MEAKLRFDLRKLGFGLFWDTLYDQERPVIVIWICLIPCFPIRLVFTR